MISELTALQNKRFKDAAETSLIVLEVDRRKRLIEEIGAQAPSNDVLVSVLWMAMDASTRSHVSGKLDVNEVIYIDLRQAVMAYTSLVGATTPKAPTPMDIGAIANVVDAGPTSEDYLQQQQKVWALDESGWPIDDEGGSRGPLR